MTKSVAVKTGFLGHLLQAMVLGKGTVILKTGDRINNRILAWQQAKTVAIGTAIGLERPIAEGL